MARTSSTILNKRGERRHLCLVPYLKGNAYSFCPLSMMLAVGFWYMTFIMFRYVPSNSTLLRVLIINGAGFYQMLFLYLDMIMWFLYFILFMWWITFIDLWMLCQPCIPGINPIWSWCVIFLMYCCVQWCITNILLTILASMFIRDIGLWLSFFVVSLSDFGIRMMLAS